MNQFLRKVLTLSLAGALLLTAAACSPEQGSTTAGTAKPATTAATSAGGAASGTTAAQVKALEGKITTSGSTSMEDLMSALGEAFSVINPKVAVEVQGGGSSTGVKNANDGVSQIGNASRTLKTEEKAYGLTEYTIAIDGIAVVLNPANKATNLTKEQLVNIFTGKVTNWKDVGGADAPIVVILREAGSGTRDGFEELLKIAGQCKATQEVNETGIVKSTVAGNVNAIGYMSLGKVDAAVKAAAVEGVVPTNATVTDKTYLLQRPFVCLTKGTESELVKAFFTYIFSKEGQAMVVKKGYVAVQ